MKDFNHKSHHPFKVNQIPLFKIQSFTFPSKYNFTLSHHGSKIDRDQSLMSTLRVNCNILTVTVYFMCTLSLYLTA